MRSIRFKLPRLNVNQEHLIEFRIRPILCLGKLEENNDDSEDRSCEENPSHSSAEIAFIGIKHVRDDNVPDGREEKVEHKSDGLGFRAKAG